MKNIGFLSLAIFLVSCAQRPLPFETPVNAPTKSPVGTPATMTPQTQRLVDLAIADLAHRLSISEENIEVVSVEAVLWPDTSLGCPQPGMAYAQVLTPGYLVLLEAGGKKYEYHASRDITIIYCENPSPPVPGTPENI